MFQRTSTLVQKEVENDQRKSKNAGETSALACLYEEDDMSYFFGGEQLPSKATVRLKIAAYGRKTGELASHQVNEDSVTVTFIETNFFGGLSRYEMSVEEFSRKFAVIRNKGAETL